MIVTKILLLAVSVAVSSFAVAIFITGQAIARELRSLRREAVWWRYKPASRPTQPNASDCDTHEWWDFAVERWDEQMEETRRQREVADRRREGWRQDEIISAARQAIVDEVLAKIKSREDRSHG